MFYDFPYIEDLAVFEALMPEYLNFRKHDAKDYVTFNYTNLDPDNFPWPLTEDWHYLMRECRGIAFSKKTGKIISRPLHKFFNYMEREETMNIPEGLKRFASDKLDGSMIHTLYLDNGTRLATRHGITDISNAAEALVATSINYQNFIAYLRYCGFTAIFEYTAPTNKIVLNYGEPKLTLLRIRSMFTGEYMDLESVCDLASDYDIPFVGFEIHENSTMEDFVNFTKYEIDEEGIIVAYENGHSVKIKSDWYVNLHRLVDIFRNDRRFVEFIYSDSRDDMYANSDKATKDKIDQAIETYQEEIDRLARMIKNQFFDIFDDNLDRKSQALLILDKVDKFYQPYAFKLLSSEDKSDEYIQGLSTRQAHEAFKKYHRRTRDWDDFKAKIGYEGIL